MTRIAGEDRLGSGDRGRLVELSHRVAQILAGQADVTMIQNIGVEACQIVEFTGRTPDLEHAVGELIAACKGGVIAPTVEDLSRGLYPSAVEEANRALLSLKTLVLP